MRRTSPATRLICVAGPPQVAGRLKLYADYAPAGLFEPEEKDFLNSSAAPGHNRPGLSSPSGMPRPLAQSAAVSGGTACARRDLKDPLVHMVHQ